MTRIALWMEYNGSEFHGWQFQPKLRTVQGELERALSQIANAPIDTHCAGRTDKGVHAKYQIVHFDTEAERPLAAWTLGVNHFLPKDISIRAAKEVPEDFHARYSAIERSYEYVIDNQATHPAILQKLVTWIPKNLNEALMHEAAQHLLGEHDFSAFRAAECQAKHPIRKILSAQVSREGKQVILKITANAFLHHMVRNIVGVLLPIGFQEKPTAWAKEVLESKKREAAGVTAPAEGLYLSHVSYGKIQPDF